MVICFKRTHVIWMMAALLLAGSAGIAGLTGHGYAAEAATAAFEERPDCEKLLVYLFLGRVQEQIGSFYVPYYTISPTVAYYSTSVKELRERGTDICVTFTAFPYIGPHDTIGEDEVTFCVDRSGEIVETSFRHLKNYALPEYLSQMEKGSLPPVSD